MPTASAALSIDDLRAAARRRLPRAVFDFFDAIARAAAAAGIPYTLSTSATASIERIAREAPGRL